MTSDDGIVMLHGPIVGVETCTDAMLIQQCLVWSISYELIGKIMYVGLQTLSVDNFGSFFHDTAK